MSRLEDVIRLWDEVLGTSGVEPDTDFFDAGGDSFLAVRLVERVESDLGAQISILEVLEGTTPRRMAAGVAAAAERAARPRQA